MRKTNKKQKNSKSQLMLLILLIVCSIITTYQTTNSKEDSAAHQPQGNIAQSILPYSDAYIKQNTASDTPEILLQRTGYLVSYNSNTRIANWVVWKLTPGRLKENTGRTDNFLPDPDLPSSKAVTTQDYKDSGWDRGHLCPAGDNKWDRKAMTESFYMTNICPQHHNLNRGDWNELEQKCRKWVKKDSCLYIVAGPIFYDRKPQTIGEHRVAVPDAFFKVILSLHKKPKAIGFIYKNNEGNNPLDAYTNTVDEVERITGIDFFPALPDDVERAVEASYDLKDWK
ncbi:DNA/RNA non-specific endonuclease [uncultured Bacteroides sp.]|jgi:DNA/RNA endonuclease G, NUC1|uniref:DNA/RNA non-specific endonuclease n=1 Tax=uncultured Bacteroides sp. TaxID=162156 RepID=UPI0025CD07EC|nr:DNA/RNA non-specific endonuclease [uncultured Bacteroides sp.]